MDSRARLAVRNPLMVNGLNLNTHMQSGTREMVTCARSLGDGDGDENENENNTNQSVQCLGNKHDYSKQKRASVSL